MRRNFWRLRMNRCIDIDDLPTGLAYALIGRTQQYATVSTAIGWLGIRKMSANITESCSPEQGVGQGMQ